MTIKIAIDCMGGDLGPSVTVPAALKFLTAHEDAIVQLVGLRDVIQDQLKQRKVSNHPRIEIIHASEVVEMDDAVEIALRKKKDSSMRIAITQVKEGKAHGVVSAGNTGALMAVSRYLLKTMEGIDRPAIATDMPNEKGGGTTVLDLGANADCEPMHLLQFAQMADVMVTAIKGIQRPSVGLLNIGEEAIKGNELVKQAGELLRVSNLNFYGNVEGNDIFKGTTEIVVCDGFVGNITLKSSEGLAKMIVNLLKEEFSRSLYTRLVAFIALPVLKSFKYRLDHRRLNGALLLGLRGLVVKSHGSADAYAFGYALQRCYDASKNQMVEHIAEAFARRDNVAADESELAVADVSLKQ